MSLPGPGWGLCRATLCSATPTPITTLEWREGWQGGRGKMEIDLPPGQNFLLTTWQQIPQPHLSLAAPSQPRAWAYAVPLTQSTLPPHSSR